MCLLMFSLNAASIEPIEGEMKCKVLESSVISVDDGIAKTFSGIQGKVSKGDYFTFHYKYTDSKFKTMTYMFESEIKKSLFLFSTVSFDLEELSYFNESNVLALFSDELNTRASTFSRNYIRVFTEHGEDVRLRRFYKGDWHGTYNHFNDLSVESHVFSCLPNTDKVLEVVSKLNEKANSIGKTIN